MVYSGGNEIIAANDRPLRESDYIEDFRMAVRTVFKSSVHTADCLCHFGFLLFI